MTPTMLYHPACALAALAIFPVHAIAATITWGVQNQGAADFDVFSDGSIITDPRFGYELGVFVPDFIPVPENVLLWDANWVRIGDRSMLDFATGDYGDSIESGSLVAAGTGRQAYVWGDNTRDPTQDLEWVLYTDPSWRAVETDVDLVWEPAGAERAIVGRIAITDPAEAGGTISRPVVLGPNAIQTASVPEPGVPALLLLGLSAFSLRRARRTGRAGSR